MFRNERDLALFEKEGGSNATAFETGDFLFFEKLKSEFVLPKSSGALRHLLFQRRLKALFEKEGGSKLVRVLRRVIFFFLKNSNPNSSH
jgi:hypothetical protein